MELCMNKKITEMFDKDLSTQQKAAFTREWNKSHKDPTHGVRGKKVSAKISENDEDDYAESEESDDNMLDEDQIAEIRLAKLKEKEKLLAKKAEKVDTFSMIQADIGEDDKLKGVKGKGKAKAKTQKGKTQALDSDNENQNGGQKAKPKTTRR